jgi:hypothetical protein
MLAVAGLPRLQKRPDTSDGAVQTSDRLVDDAFRESVRDQRNGFLTTLVR